MRKTRNHLFIAFRFLAEFTAKAGNFIIFPLLVRYLGAQGYGVQTQLTMISGVLVPIATIGLSFSVVRLVAGDPDIQAVSSRFRSSLLLVLGTSAALAAGMLATAPLLNQWFIRVDWATPVIRWSALMIVLSTLELTLNDYYRARLYIISYSVFQILQTLASIGAMAAVLAAGGGLLQVVQVSLAVKAAAFILALAYLFLAGEVEWRGRFLPRTELTAMVRFGIPIVVMGLSTWMMHLGDRAVLGYYLHVGEVGVYGAAYSLAGLLVALASPFWWPLYPMMAMHKNNQDPASLKAACRKYSSAYFLLGIPALLGLTVLSSPLLQALGSHEFAISRLTFGLLAAGLFIDQFASTARYLILLHNEPGFLRNVTILGGAVKMALNLAAVPFLGLLGAALATFLAFGMLNVLLLRWTVSRDYRLQELYDFPVIARQALCAGVMALAVYWAAELAGPGLWRLLGAAALGAVVYGALLLAVNGFQWRRLASSA